jgi:hypothetical protein
MGISPFGMITDVSLHLLYLILIGLLSWLTLLGRASSSKDTELHHEVTVLRRSNPRPHLDWADRAMTLVSVDPFSLAGVKEAYSRPGNIISGLGASQ